ncbi:MAG TPA: OmpA family protein [Candidatus Acidoferrales bacterium]|nr:OmpA family protein [Candidatus Acidoferrales bacterium]
MKIIGTFLTVCGLVAAQAPQAPNPVQQSTENAARTTAGAMPIYRVTVIARTTKAINYNHRSGSTNIDFRGTPLLPEARGEARVESKQGVIKIDARMEKLQPATKYGPEYLTYVMWAITPEGRATNVGEVLLNGDKSKLDTTAELQSFGLIVTAEPYFAVTQPSDVVVMENFVRQDTVGTIEQVDAKYELLQRGQYTLNVNPAEIKPLRLDPKVPLELYEARNAIQIARWTGAERYANDTFQKALIGLENAEGYLIGKGGKKPIGTVAREAVQMAEDARIITVKKIDSERLAAERQAGVDRELVAENGRVAAQADAARTAREAEAAQLAALAEADRVKRDHAARMEAAQVARDADAERARRDNAALMAAAQADADRARRDNAALIAAAQNEADRLKLQNDARTLAAQNEADRLKIQNDAKAAAAQNEADRLKRDSDALLDRAAKDKAQAEAEKVELRAQLLRQFNAILQTRDTARGLIVNMSDVLFDTAKFTLRPLAREKLAKVAGIVSGHPGLRLAVEGHTDSVGGDDYNQRLSEQRGESVRAYLTQQGMPQSSVTAKGYGKTQPVASNDTASGRQQNRRVEIVISGDVIGTEITITPVVVVR